MYFSNEISCIYQIKSSIITLWPATFIKGEKQKQKNKKKKYIYIARDMGFSNLSSDVSYEFVTNVFRRKVLTLMLPDLYCLRLKKQVSVAWGFADRHH